MEPGARKSPLAIQRAKGRTGGLRDFFEREAGEVTHHHEASLFRIDGFEIAEGLVQREKVVVKRARWIDDGGERRVKGEVGDVATPLDGPLAPGLLDEDVAHGAGGGKEEMSAAFVGGVLVDQPHVRLVDEGGGLEGLRRRGRELRLGDAAEFVVEKGDKFLSGERLSCGSRVEEPGDGLFEALCHAEGVQIEGWETSV